MIPASSLAAPGPKLATGRKPIAILPDLRDDLDLVPGPRQTDGSPSWTIHDPLRNCFFRIGWREFRILSEWRPMPPDALAALISKRGGIVIDPQDVQALAEFLLGNQLAVCADADGVARLIRDRDARKRNIGVWLLHSYLFFRVPLLRPDGFLGRVAPYCRFFFGRAYWSLLGVVALLGLYLIGRQWDKFEQSLANSLSLQGFAWFAAALAVSKVIHEFGHGLTAKHHGLRVPSMGVAFLLFWPVPYTDTTDAWRLTLRRARMEVDLAGVAAEISLAVLATLIWCAAPDGALRNAAFAIAVVNWVSTVAINLSPFMRFDGYYVLSDWLEVPNLQNRAFALARWRLREFLFGFGVAPPEQFSSRRRRLLLFYAYFTWIYRFFLFVGIAFAVYHYFFKLLGLFLLVVELWWFILRPIGQEVRVWLKQRSGMNLTRGGVATLGAIAALFLALFVPWYGEVGAPAFLGAQQVSKIYAPVPGRLANVQVRDGETVAANALIFGLDSSTLRQNIKLAELEIEALRREIEQTGSDAAQAEKQPVLIEKLLANRAKLAGLLEEQKRLEIHAPFAGRIQQLNTDIYLGQWLNEKTLLGVLVDPTRVAITAYVSEHDLSRVRIGARARFLPSVPEGADFALVVQSIEPSNIAALSVASLASIYGGDIPVTREPDGALKPTAAVYRVHFAAIEAGVPIASEMRGTVFIDAPAQSLIVRIWRQAAAVVVRELNF